jgi:deazaflavin-dependent oxidoreductase (nitroreductase family)
VLYRLRLGRLLGHRFLHLTHRGRKSGQPHQTVLEVVRYDPATHTPTVVSGFGPRSDWYLNLLRTPLAKIKIAAQEFEAQAVPLSIEEAIATFHDYARSHPHALTSLAKVLGYPWDGTDRSFQALAETLPMIAFHPIK